MLKHPNYTMLACRGLSQHFERAEEKDHYTRALKKALQGVKRHVHRLYSQEGLLAVEGMGEKLAAVSSMMLSAGPCRQALPNPMPLSWRVPALLATRQSCQAAGGLYTVANALACSAIALRARCQAAQLCQPVCCCATGHIRQSLEHSSSQSAHV